MKKEITELLEKAAHDLYKEKYPSIYEFVKVALNSGGNPESIGNALLTCLGENDRNQAHQVCLVARYLIRCPDGA
ncbi:MAG: hypothetical protein ABI366_11105 [Ginsengibacter sp.]